MTAEIPFDWLIVESSWLKIENEFRLDALFYSRDRIKATVLIERLRKSGIEIKNVGDASLSKKIFWPGRFKRKYTSKKYGKPFLTPTDVFMFLPRPRKFIIDFPENILIDNKWILITRSGTIGRTIISNKVLSSYVISDDIIRLIPEDNSILGYLYAYLNTWIGQAFLTKSQYGANVKHIEPNHVAEIPIPLLSDSEIREINNKILIAHKLREEAQILLLKAEEALYRELGLPKIEEDNIKYFGGDEGRIVKAFILKSHELNLRLDATYYSPLYSKAREILRQKEREKYFKLLKLDNTSITKKIFTPPRFKRLYVKNKEEGIPLLQGSHVPMIRYFDVKYIWKKMREINRYLIRENWILVTCSGTIGRVLMVSKYLNGWAATNHMTRIIVSEERHPGYLTVFLQSLYGQYQLLSLGYGAVVEEIGEAGELFNDILIPIPYSNNVEKTIGELVSRAYSYKDKAIMIENDAINRLERLLAEYSK